MFLSGSDKHRDEKPGSHVHHDVWNPAGELWSVASFLGQSDLFHPKILNVFWLLPLLPKLSLQLSWVEFLLSCFESPFRCCFSPMNFSWFHPKVFFFDRFDAQGSCYPLPLLGLSPDWCEPLEMDGGSRKIYRKPWP